MKRYAALVAIAGGLLGAIVGATDSMARRRTPIQPGV